MNNIAYLSNNEIKDEINKVCDLRQMMHLNEENHEIKNIHIKMDNKMEFLSIAHEINNISLMLNKDFDIQM